MTRPEQARDQRADQREEDDGLDHSGSALHHVDVVNRDRAAVAVEDDEDGEADRRFGRGDGQDQQREDLPGEIAELGGERRRS